MKTAKSTGAAKSHALILLAVVLAVLFWKSFLPGYVHFSNDGPLGAQNAAYGRLPGAFTGTWGDLNDIGGNAGTFPLGLTSLTRWALGPVGYSKFLAPIALFILGTGAWFFFRQLKLSPLAATLGALAAALNSTFFSTACWGVAAQQIAAGMDFFALALVVSNSPTTPALIRWTRLALAGLAVGINVTEAADIGAIFSLCVAGFVIYLAFTGEMAWTRVERIVIWIIVNLGFVLLLLFILFAGYGTNYYLRGKLIVPLLVIPACVWNWAMATRYTLANRLAHSIARVGVVAIFAGFMATQMLVSLIGTQIQGVAGTAQDEETKAAHWDWATQWSEPKIETLGIFVPGLFGYKMNTPNYMMTNFLGIPLQEYYKGGVYWGGIGRDPNIDRLFDRIFQPGDGVTIGINTPDHPNQNVDLKTDPDGNINFPMLGPIKVAGLSGLKIKELVDQSYASQGIRASVELPGGSFMRFTGSGYYAGIFAALVAAWTIAQSLRRRDSLFTTGQRRLIWFWAALMIVSLLLAYGRFAPFYQFVYKLPYFSTIRNPAKYLIMFSWAMVILFACGIHALHRRYLETPAGKMKSPAPQPQVGWKNAGNFDRKWTIACGIIFIGSVLAWLVYASQKANLVRYLQAVQFDEGMAKEIAAFSIGQVGWFILFFALAILLFVLVISGTFSGKRAKLGGILLGALLVLDLGRADLPYIIHWDYVQKYDIDPNYAGKSTNPIIKFLHLICQCVGFDEPVYDSTNPVINFLRDKPCEHRVAILPFRMPEQFSLFEQLYHIEWTQHHFLYYNIQSLDVIQQSRLPADMDAYYRALGSSLTRRWELSNTSYLLGPAGFLDALNENLDPVQRRFHILQRFQIAPKPGIEQATKLEEMTAVLSDNGDLALFEFTGALPRAGLYTDWQTNNPDALKNFTTNGFSADDFRILGEAGTNDFLILKKLASPSFDPHQTVLLGAPLPDGNSGASTNNNPGSVEFKPYNPEDPAFKGKKNDLWQKNGYCYAPRDIMLDANATAPSVLLLNDKYDPNWSVTVDGKPAQLLRCNFIMRGVYLEPGQHTVEFQFSMPHKPLYVTLSAFGVGILLCGILIVSSRRKGL